MVLGVRPADVLAHGAPREGTSAARVSVLEPTGSDLWVSADWTGRRIKARAAPGAALERGATVHLEIPAERIYAFDRTSGSRRKPT